MTNTREVLHSSETTEWYTPPHIIDLVRNTLGKIDLDPASNSIAQQWINANNFYTKHDSPNGLEVDWYYYETIWLNPPYGKNMQNWIVKLIDEFKISNISENNNFNTNFGVKLSAITLVRPAVSTTWYNLLASEFLKCETFKRIKFIDNTGIEQSSPAHGNVFFLLSRNPDIITKFCENFNSIGIISRPIKSYN